MSLLSLLIAVVLGMLALTFVLYPLYRHRVVSAQPAASVSSLSEGEQTARTALQEVELDFQLGNLAEHDYRSLRERYMRRAFLAMKSRQAHEQKLDQEIEEQLHQMKEHNEQTTE